MRLLKFFLFFIIVLFYLGGLTKITFAQDSQIEEHYKLSLYFFENKDYYRSVSELYRLKFYYKIDEIRLDTLLAKNYYVQKEYTKLEKLSEKYLLKETNEANTTLFILTALSYLKNDSLIKAKKLWEKGEPEKNFWQSENLELLNPEKAFWLSLFPGLGFAYTNDYKSAVLAFLLNGSFIYLTVETFNKKQYATSFLLFFFEYQFYLGGMRAAAESAINYNEKIINEDKKLFIKIYETKFGIR